MDPAGDLRHMRRERRRVTLLAMQNTSSTTTRSIVRELSVAAALAAAIFSPGALLALAQARPSPGTSAATAPQQPPDLVAALRATPGVLGVEAGQMTSGKQAIFAWFENKQAVLTWFYSDAHQALMRTFTPGAASGRTPLAQIADDSGPILAIASITMSGAPQVGGVQMPVSQIAIELYAALPGGLAAGGRFAPSAVKVPGLIEVPAAAPPR